ncbi:MAG: hypothetical protein ACKOWK_02465 [Micrococcales bacterium]
MQEDNNAQPVEQGPIQETGVPQEAVPARGGSLSRGQVSLILAITSFVTGAGVFLVSFAIAILGGILGAMVGATGGYLAQGAQIGFSIGLGLMLTLGFSTVYSQFSVAVVVFALATLGFVSWHVSSLKSSGVPLGKLGKWSLALAVLGAVVAVAMLGVGSYLHGLSGAFGSPQ